MNGSESVAPSKSVREPVRRWTPLWRGVSGYQLYLCV